MHILDGIDRRIRPLPVYLGTFVLALSMLALEITLTRMLSVMTWYHLAFFAVSTAMLGMTSGATVVYVKPRPFESESLMTTLTKTCLAYGVSIPVSLVMLCLAPLRIPNSPMGYFALLQATIACSLPFFFAGIVITAVLTKIDLPIGKLYASDLIGASAGCILVLGGLEIMSAPDLILLCAPLGGLAGLCFGWRSPAGGLRRTAFLLIGALFLLAISNVFLPSGIRPVMVKGAVETADMFLIERWNSYSRVVVSYGRTVAPFYWGPSPIAPRDPIRQHWMTIDGEAGTTLTEFTSDHDAAYLQYDVTNLVYFLRPSGGACIIGIGGGRDIQSALLFGHKEVTGIDINPIFVDLLEGQFRDFSGIGGRDGVRLIVDDARAFLAKTDGSFSVIQMSLIDTWAATGVGAFSLSENALYTTQAWSTMLDDLSGDGIFTVSRWFDPENLGETGRLLSLAVATLIHMGVENPSEHIVLATSGSVSSLLLSKSPLTPEDLMKLQRVTSRLQYLLPVSPGHPPDHRVMASIVNARSLEELNRIASMAILNTSPPTDDNPYFFNMLRLRHINQGLRPSQGVLRGNMIASLTLFGLILCLFGVAVITIIVPLVVKTGSTTGRFDRLNRWSAAYFSLIGAGFMFVEIALIQRLSVFLGHPVYALGILLLTIIASAGVGSLLSEKLPLTRAPWMFAYPVLIVVLVLTLRYALPILSTEMVASSVVAKILASIVAIAPVGLAMGVCFPTGMRFVNQTRRGETPWYWALNGVFGVLCSALAVFVSIYFGITMSLYVGAACYALLLVCLPRMAGVESV